MATGLKPFVVLAKRLEKSETERYCSASYQSPAVRDISLLKDIGKYEAQQDQSGAYCAIIPNEGDRNVVSIFEAYDSKDYLMTGHRSGEAYKKFKEIETKEDMLYKPTEVAFYTTKFGFLQRSDTPKEPLGEQFIWMAKLTAKPGKRDEMLEACRVHSGNVERDEKETLSFVVLESQDNDVDVLLFERYGSEKYFKEVHFTSESMQEYRGKTGPLLEGRESGGFSVVAGFMDKRETLH